MNMKNITKFTTLYSQNSNRTMQTWTITVTGNVISKVYGVVGGKQQSTEEVISSGKNIGRKNETTAEEQAIVEARSMWEHKLKTGYSKQLETAESGEVDSE